MRSRHDKKLDSMRLLASIHQWGVGIFLSLAVSVSAPLARGQTLQTLHSFRGTEGAQPYAGLVQGDDGSFYGTTHDGVFGTGFGTIFRITSDGALTTLVAFNGSNGKWPYSGLTLGSDGNFYGTTSQGGVVDAGTVFRMTTNGALTTLVSFDGNNGAYPYAGLVRGSDGNFYGSSHYSFGSVFRVTANGAVSRAVTLNGTNGSGDVALTPGNDGLLYGTTTSGGSNNGSGTVFKMTVGGALTTLVTFRGSNGASPVGIVQGRDGNFYGMTALGGAYGLPNGYGTVFKMAPNGTLTTLVSFNDTNGNRPGTGLIQASDGNFYGTTYNGGTHGLGTAFQITTNGVLTTLVSLNHPDGVYPFAGLVQGRDGIFYGTAPLDSDPSGFGTVFRIVMPVSLSVRQAGNQIALGWSTNFAPGFTLQSTLDLTAPATWIDSTNSPVGVSDQVMVTNVVSGERKFYRLRRP